MAEDLFPSSAGQAGSAGDSTTSPGGGTSPGDLGQNTGAGLDDLKVKYEEAEKLIGTQGRELGDLRTFFKNIEPLLEKLDAQPDVIKAILDGKVNTDLAKAALEGKVKIDDAAIVSAAHDQVKKDMGDKKYEGATSEEIAKLVEARAVSIKEDITQMVEEREDLRNFEEKTSYFIANTADFEKYADDINRWLQENTDQDNIEIAYHAVKGMALQKAIERGDKEAFAEMQKDLALNASGGASQGGSMVAGPDVADELIAQRSNPNVL